MARTRYGGRFGGPMERARVSSIGEPIYGPEGTWWRSGGDSITINELKSRIEAVFHDTYDATKADVISKAKDIVPKRTGQLLKSVLESIDNWRREGEMVHLEIKSDIEYADKITGVPAHFGTWYEHDGTRAYAYYGGHKGRIYLDDPHATVQWKMRLIAYTYQQWRNYFESYKLFYGV